MALCRRCRATLSRAEQIADAEGIVFGPEWQRVTEENRALTDWCALLLTRCEAAGMTLPEADTLRATLRQRNVRC